MSGWYLMHRGWMKSRDFRPEPFTDREAYQWSIESAAHTPHRQWFNGTLYAVERGELITSLHAMGEAFQWSDKRVRGFVQRMVKAEKWAKQGAHAGAKAPTRLIVVNYDEFQSPPREWGKATDKEEGERGAQQGQSKGEEQNELGNKGNEFQTMGEERGASPPAPALPYSDALEAWTQAASIKGWKPLKPDLTDKRRKGLAGILKVHGLSGFVGVLQQAMDSEWLGGPDPPPWFNFTFICSPENFTKVKDGNYNAKFKSSPIGQQRSSAWLDAREQLSVGSL